MGYIASAAKELWNGALLLVGILVGMAIEQKVAPSLELSFTAYGMTIAVTDILLIAAGVIYGGVFLYKLFKKKQDTFPNGLLIGNPLDSKKGVYRYRHKDAPSVLDMINAAEKNVGAVVVGGLFLTSLIDRDYKRITNEKTLTLCLQPEGSPMLKEQSRHTGSPDLSDKIRTTMELLHKRKDEIDKKENLIIRNHEQYLTHSIVVFDIDNDEKTCVRAVEYSSEPQDDWVARVIFKAHNKQEYEKYCSKYRDIIENHSRVV